MKINSYLFVSDSDYSEIIIHSCDEKTAINNLKYITKHPFRYRLETKYEVSFRNINEVIL